MEFSTLPSAALGWEWSPHIRNQFFQNSVLHVGVSYLHIDTPEVLIVGFRDSRRPIPFPPGHGGAALLGAERGPVSPELDFGDGVCRDPVGNGALLEVCGIARVFDHSFYQGTKRDGKDTQCHQHLDERKTIVFHDGLARDRFGFGLACQGYPAKPR